MGQALLPGKPPFPPQGSRQTFLANPPSRSVHLGNNLLPRLPPFFTLVSRQSFHWCEFAPAPFPVCPQNRTPFTPLFRSFDFFFHVPPVAFHPLCVPANPPLTQGFAGFFFFPPPSPLRSAFRRLVNLFFSRSFVPLPRSLFLNKKVRF